MEEFQFGNHQLSDLIFQFQINLILNCVIIIETWQVPAN